MSLNDSMKIIATNRKVNFQYFLIEKFEAGIQLLGSEVKAIREGNVNIKESYVKFDKDEFIIHSKWDEMVGNFFSEYSEPIKLDKNHIHSEFFYYYVFPIFFYILDQLYEI